MNPLEIIQAGESLEFKFDRGGDSIDGWICTINVKQYPQDASVITRVIQPDTDSNSWSGFLTSTETSGLAGGLWFIIGVLTKSSTDEEEQIPERFFVSTPWA